MPKRFLIRWTHLIEKESLRFKELEHVLIEKVDQLFRNMLRKSRAYRFRRRGGNARDGGAAASRSSANLRETPANLLKTTQGSMNACPAVPEDREPQASAAHLWLFCSIGA
jgi:hypothetical protein